MSNPIDDEPVPPEGDYVPEPDDSDSGADRT